MVYKYTDYKQFLNDLIAVMPKKGHGQARKLAEHLGVHSVVASQILSGDRDFTYEQSLDVASYFGLDENATEYFSTLVLKARAGTKKLENYLEKKLATLKAEAEDIKNRVPAYRKLNEEDQAIYYSNWYYCATHILTSIKGFDNIDSISTHLGVHRTKIAEVLEYLVARGLCAQDAKGRYSPGTTSTFVDAKSPFVNNLHRNWRIKALEKMTTRKPNDFYYSIPTSLSEKDKDVLREELVKLAAKFVERSANSKPEKLVCLNIDWFDC